MGARRGKPLSKQSAGAASPESTDSSVQPAAPKEQPYGSPIYGPEGIYTGYMRGPFGPIRGNARRPLSEKSRRPVENILNFLDGGRSANQAKAVETDQKEETSTPTTTPVPSYSLNKQKRLEKKSERYKARAAKIDSLVKQYGTTSNT